MKLLLDTHIWFWLVSDITRLGKRAHAEITDAQNELWFSPISTWELVTLNAKGRIRLGGDPENWFERAKRGLLEAPVTHEVAKAAAELPLHRDPADRFIAATAQVLGLTLVTADEKLLGLGSIQSLANR
ncbi:MAG TPA: type II toxin-antitoxin system VapC family toxin [Candidatus Acidoferrum sp.]|nr:type II toxin-antitoxin system VapC family toxin [Candidatus Acidoferrum sp.]